jgi:hypothetical protein
LLDDSAPVAARDVASPWDLAPGEDVVQDVTVCAPSVLHTYDFAIAVRQAGTTAFDGFGNGAFRRGVRVDVAVDARDVVR